MISPFKRKLDKQEIGYEPESESEGEVGSKIEGMGYITRMTMEEYNRWMHNENWSGLVPPEIPSATNFELKGHILNMLKDIPLYEKDHEDSYRHIDEVFDIANYFNVPHVTRDTVL